MPDEFVNVRYMVDDVDAAVAFYTSHFGFQLRTSAAPAFADVTRGHLRLLLSGPASSAGRPMPDGRTPQPGGWNRIHLIVDDIAAEVERLRAAGLTFRNDIVTGPGGPEAIHWSLRDPAREPGTDEETLPAFERTAAELETRIGFLIEAIKATKAGGERRG